MVRDLLEKLMNNDGSREVRVGVIGPELAKELSDLQNSHDAEHDAISEQIKAYSKKLRDEHKPRCVELQLAQDNLWEKIYDKLELTEIERGLEYIIKQPSGIAFRVVDND